MLVAERLRFITDLVSERGTILVSELSEMCGVTKETIRRDLDKLEQDGVLFRSHGGAISPRTSALEIPYIEREQSQVNEKMLIAKHALQYINEGDQIVLDTSTTAWYLSTALPDMSLTVITNSIRIITELSSRQRMTVISTGGVVLDRSLSLVGPLAHRSLESYHVSKAFISCAGLHLDQGLSEFSEPQALVKQKMVDISDEVFMLVDHSKFDVQAFTHSISLDEVDTLITDESKESTEYVNRLRERVRVETVV